jgi:hypothetical protein
MGISPYATILRASCGLIVGRPGFAASRGEGRTTTTSTGGLLVSEARVRKQVTGINLNGFADDAEDEIETEGPAINSCPSGPWVLTTPAGDPQPVEGFEGELKLEVRADGGAYVELAVSLGTEE